MIESFHSEGGRDNGSRRISWSIERNRNRAASVGNAMRHPPAQSSFPPGSLSSRNLISEDPPSHESQTLLDTSSEHISPTVATARSSQATRKGSTLVFLGVWALFGFGTLTFQGTTYSGNSTKVGRVLSSIVYDVPSLPVILEKTVNPVQSHAIRSLEGPGLIFIDRPTTYDKLDSAELSSERMLGRFFAWACATLYLTSRLPQIWKNVGVNLVKVDL